MSSRLLLAAAILLATTAAPAHAAIADKPALEDFPTATAPAVRAAMKQAGWQEFAAADGVKMEDFQDGKTWGVYFVKGEK